jgi:hypothetical protein
MPQLTIIVAQIEGKSNMKRIWILAAIALILAGVIIGIVLSAAQITQPLSSALQTQIIQTANAVAIGTAKANNP